MKTKKNASSPESEYQPSPYFLQQRAALIQHFDHLLASSAEGWILLGPDHEGRYPWELIGVRREEFEGIIADAVAAEIIRIEIDPLHGRIARRVEETFRTSDQLSDDGSDT